VRRSGGRDATRPFKCTSLKLHPDSYPEQADLRAITSLAATAVNRPDRKKWLAVNGRAAADPGLVRWSGLVRDGMGQAALDVMVMGWPSSASICRMWFLIFLSLSVGADLVVAGAEVGVPGGRVGEQVPDVTRMERATATWALALPRRRAIRW
jgi:hypothetical protein